MLKKLLNVLMVAAIIINVSCVGNVFAADSKIIEMSYGREFSSSGSGSGSLAELCDGITADGGFFVQAAAENTTVWISVDLEDAYDIESVELYPQSGEYDGSFPKQFKVLVSDNADFSSSSVVYDCQSDYYTDSISDAQKLILNGANGRYIRIESSKNGEVNGNYGMGFSEIKVNADTYSKKSVLSLNKTVTVAQNINGNYAVNGSTSVTNPAQLTDGSIATLGGYANQNTKVSSYGTEYAPNVKIYFIIDLEEKSSIKEVALTPRPVESTRYGSYYPIRFEIHVSDTADFATYEKIYESTSDEYDFEISTNIWGTQSDFGKAVGPTTKQSYKAEGEGRYIRLVTTKNSFIANGGNDSSHKWIWPHFGEIEVYGQKTVELTNVSSGKTFKSYSLDYKGDVVSDSVTDDITTLSDGVISKDSRAVYTKGSFSTATDTRNSHQICFETDLGDTVSIKQIKLSPDTYMSYGSRFPVGFVLEASENADFSNPVTLYSNDEYWDDPNEWYEATEKVYAGPTETQVFNVSGKGRYVRIRTTTNSAAYNNLNDAQGYIQIGFTEFEILSGIDFSMTNKYYNSSNEEISEDTDLTGVDSVRVSTTLENNTGYVHDAIVLRVLYKNNTMQDISIDRMLLDSSKTIDDKTFVLDDENKNDYVIKTMLWDGSVFIKPYISNLTFPIK